MFPIDFTTICFFLSFPITILGIIKLRNRHRERLALIQYGKSAEIFSQRRENPNRPMKIGLLLFSIGTGLLVGGMLDNIFDTAPLCAFSCILILGGFSLMFYHQKFIKDNDKYKPTSYEDEDNFL